MGCAFTAMGGTALWLDQGSQGCSVVNSTFDDTSGSAIVIGGIGYPHTAAAHRTLENSVQHCTIRRTSVEYHGAAALAVGYAARTTITHNLIRNLSFTGISLCWGWNNPSDCAEQEVAYNEVSHSMCGELLGTDHTQLAGVVGFRACSERRVAVSDGGSVYTMCQQPGSSIHHNWLHHQCVSAAAPFASSFEASRSGCADRVRRSLS